MSNCHPVAGPPTAQTDPNNCSEKGANVCFSFIEYNMATVCVTILFMTIHCACEWISVLLTPLLRGKGHVCRITAFLRWKRCREYVSVEISWRNIQENFFYSTYNFTTNRNFKILKTLHNWTPFKSFAAKTRKFIMWKT